MQTMIIEPQRHRGNAEKPFHRRDAKDAEKEQFMANVKVERAASSLWFESTEKLQVKSFLRTMR
jgi:hypothetical protein